MKYLMLLLVAVFAVNCGKKKEETKVTQPTPIKNPAPAKPAKANPEKLAMPTKVDVHAIRIGLSQAIQKDDADEIDYWLAQDNVLGSPNDYRPLFKAIEEGKVRAVEHLLRRGADANLRVKPVMLNTTVATDKFLAWTTYVDGHGSRVKTRLVLTQLAGVDIGTTVPVMLVELNDFTGNLVGDFSDATTIGNDILAGKPFWTNSIVYPSFYVTPYDVAKKALTFAPRDEKADAREILGLIVRFGGKAGLSLDEAMRKTPTYQLFSKRVWKDGKLQMLLQSKETPKEFLPKAPKIEDKAK